MHIYHKYDDLAKILQTAGYARIQVKILPVSISLRAVLTCFPHKICNQSE
uniref:Uncharacterized protein n=1 Tax=Octopus bimaculoides TaxID=37653 RepID=A0A0L8FZU1_OCTBM